MRSDVTTITANAASLEEAHEIVGRLTQAGFARNSVDVERRGESAFAVSIHVRDANRRRAQQAIENRWGSLPSVPVSNTALMLVAGGAAAALAGAWALWSKQQSAED
jgi:hypothetical protein